MPKKYFKLVIISIIIIFSITFLSINNIRKLVKDLLPTNIKTNFKLLIFGEKYIEDLEVQKKLNYNVHLLPDTEFVKLSLKKINIPDLDENSLIDYQPVGLEKTKSIFRYKRFYINLFNDEIHISSATGKFFTLDLNKFIISEISSNIKKFNIHGILDSEIINNEIYISIIKKVNLNNKSDCFNLEILKAKVNNTLYEFNSRIKFNECLSEGVSTRGGRIIKYSKAGKNGILITTGTTDDIMDQMNAQNDSSISGKILFVEDESNSYEIFSKGHRNPQGIMELNGKIIETEHGPYGGDEINLIEYKNNYGWPIISFGDDYNLKKNNKNLEYRYKKENEKGYTDPIYAFVPSIAISELISIPNSFEKKWQNNILVSSLNQRSLYRILLDKNYTKVLYAEKIYIGERIRDIKFDKKRNIILLALEDTGSIGIISTNIEK